MPATAVERVNQPLWIALPAVQQGLAAEAAVSALPAAQQDVRGTSEGEAHPQHAGKFADAGSCSSTSPNETQPSTKLQQVGCCWWLVSGLDQSLGFCIWHVAMA